MEEEDRSRSGTKKATKSRGATDLMRDLFGRGLLSGQTREKRSEGERGLRGRRQRENRRGRGEGSRGL